MNKPLIFETWLCRCSQLGKLLTNLPTEEAKQKIKDDMKVLENERDLGVNVNGNKVKWTPKKESDLLSLKEKLKKEEEDHLPSGAITYLEEEFRRVYWGRKRELSNKYLTKGTIAEEDALELLSFIDGTTYWKNEEFLENQYICGTPDNRQVKEKDTKCSWDLESFDKAELTTLYAWQLKGYMWLEHNYDNKQLQTKTEAELCYCLVNAPLISIENERKSLYYQMNMPDEADDEWIETVQQLERNMIFDVPSFKKTYPNYDFYNMDLDFSIPAHMRVKKFDVTLNPEDIKHMTRRVTMARKWLVNKEIETNKIRYGYDGIHD